MALGDGIRRNLSTVDPAERKLLKDAIVECHKRFFPGVRTDTPPGGVSWWFKQDEIHQATHVHGGPEFIPWHRTIVNRFEELIRQVNPQLSLHYWNWTQDASFMFTPDFMGNGNGDAGEPWLGAGFYKPGADPYRGDSAFDTEHNNPVDPPRTLTRGYTGGTFPASTDTDIVNAPDYKTMWGLLEDAHNSAHSSVLGGTIGDAHVAFRDPLVFLLHSNVDRLFARWQTDPAHPERLNPTTVYSGLDASELAELDNNVEPWSTGVGEFHEIRPWSPPENQGVPFNYKHITVVAPPCYDTNQSSFKVLEAENPFNMGTNRFQVIFNDVPEEETTWRPAVVRVFSCGDVTIRVKAGTEPAAPFGVVTPSVLTHHTPTTFVDVKLWFQFTAGAVGTAPQNLGPVNTTLECVETGQEFLFELRANTIHRETVAVELSLDQSGSMSDPAGTSGATRLLVLKDAANLFANLIQKNNGIGIVRFDEDAYPPTHPTFGGMVITKVLSDGFGDPARIAALNAIAAHGAHGATSVGDGLVMARNQLNALAPGSYDHKAILLLTDGLENRAEWIAGVGGSIDNRTFAVGLGNEFQVNTTALTAVAGGTGGYLLLSGLLSGSLDDQFRLRKFFLQILANVTKTSIVKDPVGYINSGTRVKIPFRLSEADINCRVILLTDFPVVRLSVETPDGQLIDELNAASFGVTFDTTQGLKTASFNLPLAFAAGTIHGGTWQAILEVDDEVLKRFLSGQPGRTTDERALAELRSKGAKYCLSAHSFSNLRMNAAVDQSGFVPGSTLSLRASLSEYNLPVEKRAEVRAELEYPDRTRTTLLLNETGPGIFETSLPATLSGIYRFRILAEGGTYRGTPFEREQLLTAAVFNQVEFPPGQGPDGRGEGGTDTGLVGGEGGTDGGTGVAAAFERCCRRMGLFVWLIIFLLVVIIILLLLRR
jgi:hypothetical protein